MLSQNFGHIQDVVTACEGPSDDYVCTLIICPPYSYVPGFSPEFSSHFANAFEIAPPLPRPLPPGYVFISLEGLSAEVSEAAPVAPIRPAIDIDARRMQHVRVLFHKVLPLTCSVSNPKFYPCT
eukprot:5828229-Pyramimonas_sp.AAC.2